MSRSVSCSETSQLSLYLQPLSLSLDPHTPLKAAIAAMAEAQVSRALVIYQGKLLGLLTEQDIFKAVGLHATGTLGLLDNVPIAELLTTNPVTVPQARLGEIDYILQLFQDTQLPELPVVDAQNTVVGMLTAQAVYRVLGQWQQEQAEARVQEVSQELHAIFMALPDLFFRLSMDGTILDYITCQPENLYRSPDQLLGRKVPDVLPYPVNQLFANAIQQVLDTHQMVQVDYELPMVQGEQSFEARIFEVPTHQLMMVVRNITKRKQIEIERQRTELALRRRIESEQALHRVVQAIRNSLDLNDIFPTAVYEIGQLIGSDRAEICRYLADESTWSTVAVYRRSPDLPESLGLAIPDRGHWIGQRLQQLELVQIGEMQISDIAGCDLLSDSATNQETDYPGTWLIVPLQVGTVVWGALSLNFIQPDRQWQPQEIEVIRTLADQLAIAIQQSQLYQQVQHYNLELEAQVRQRTAELQRLLEFEARLKRITDQVRDSLDEDKILQTAVHELGMGLGVECCNAAIYNHDLSRFTITHEYTLTLPACQGQEFQVDQGMVSQIVQQLSHGYHCQFCFIQPDHYRPWIEHYTILACPLVDDQGQLVGDLWLYKQRDDCFNEQEIRLVEQVANQCAIALRQSRLYQTAQAQVEELERVNHLKDDFLSTVSHELRTPMANIKMAAQMLEIMVFRDQTTDPVVPSFPALTQASRYFQILKDECQRETELINDLLDLSRLDANVEPILPSTMELQTWLPYIAEPFQERMQQQGQLFSVAAAADLPPFTTDYSYLTRILSELLHNACKYTPQGEAIRVSAQWLTNQQMQIQVSNSGVQIPDDELCRVFDKFYRVPSNDPWKHGGTGLGLTLVQKLVEYLQGEITVASDQGWTIFTVCLPTISSE